MMTSFGSPLRSCGREPQPHRSAAAADLCWRRGDDRRGTGGCQHASSELGGAGARAGEVSDRRADRLAGAFEGWVDHGVRVPEGAAPGARGCGAGKVLARRPDNTSVAASVTGAPPPEIQTQREAASLSACLAVSRSLIVAR